MHLDLPVALVLVPPALHSSLKRKRVEEMFTAHAQKKAIVRSDSADLSLAKDKFEWGPPVSPSPSSAQLPDMSTGLGSLLKERIFTSVLPRPRYSSFTKAAIVVGLDEGKLKLHDGFGVADPYQPLQAP